MAHSRVSVEMIVEVMLSTDLIKSKMNVKEKSKSHFKLVVVADFYTAVKSST